MNARFLMAASLLLASIPSTTSAQVPRLAVRARAADAEVARRLREALAGAGYAVEPVDWGASPGAPVSLVVWVESGRVRVCRSPAECDSALAESPEELLVDVMEIVRARLREATPTPAARRAQPPEPERRGEPSAERGVELRLGVAATSVVPPEELTPDLQIGGLIALAPLPWLEIGLRLDAAALAHRRSGAPGREHRVRVQSLALGVGFAPLLLSPIELSLRLEGGVARVVASGPGVERVDHVESFAPLGALTARLTVLFGRILRAFVEIGGRVSMEVPLLDGEVQSGVWGAAFVDVRLGLAAVTFL